MQILNFNAYGQIVLVMFDLASTTNWNLSKGDAGLLVTTAYVFVVIGVMQH